MFYSLNRIKKSIIAFMVGTIAILTLSYPFLKEEEPFAIRTDKLIRDLQAIPQEASLVKTFDIPLTTRSEHTKAMYFKEYFKAWSDFEFTVSTLNLEHYSRDECFDQTLKACSVERRQEMIDNANINQHGNINQFGIITQNTDLRALPSLLPWFYNPQDAGEGYPFDNLQRDFLYIGMPVRISHLSQDKAFAYVQIPNYAEGWVKVQNVVILSPEAAAQWQANDIAIIKKENVSLITVDGEFVDYAKVGTHLPILRQEGNTVWLQVPHKNPSTGFGTLIVKLSADSCVITPENFTPETIAAVIKELINKPYGWGATLGNRDCSALTKDFYRVFHIWLPRHSPDQYSWAHHKIDLKNKTRAEKLQIIKERGIPFKTLLFQPGHISIYCGIYNDEPIIFHAVWGNRTQHGDRNGRNVIGVSAFTTTHFGQELKWLSKPGTTLDKLEGMAMLEPAHINSLILQSVLEYMGNTLKILISTLSLD
jgi:cell wall-associated NlpC family hydrolase